MTTPQEERPALEGLSLRLELLEAEALYTLNGLILRVDRLEADVRRQDALMAPLKLMPDAELGEPQTALEFLSYLVGILKGRMDVLEERVAAQELRWKEFTSL
jgi:hypothetical protein